MEQLFILHKMVAQTRIFALSLNVVILPHLDQVLIFCVLIISLFCIVITKLGFCGYFIGTRLLTRVETDFLKLCADREILAIKKLKHPGTSKTPIFPKRPKIIQEPRSSLQETE